MLYVVPRCWVLLSIYQAAALRHLLPLLPELIEGQQLPQLSPRSAEVTSAKQAFAWLTSAHNLSAALAEVE